MGSYSYLQFDHQCFSSEKKGFDRKALSLFDDDDFVVDDTPLKPDEQAIYDTPPQSNFYAITRAQAIDRLNVMGFTMDGARKIYDDWVNSTTNSDADYDTDCDTACTETALDFETFFGAIKATVRARIDTLEIIPLSKVPEENQSALMPSQNYPHFFPSEDQRWAIRVFLEAADQVQKVILDLTELVESENLQITDTFCQDAKIVESEQRSITEPILVLTEGSIDSELLKRCLKVIYPHLNSYITFIDFHSFRSPGGVSDLVKLVKALGGSNISSRIVAVFDNDAGAREALRSLNVSKLPRNIRTLPYPPTEIIRSYPTVGPSGNIEAMDISGRAASIELYFGREVLTDPATNELFPVRWTSFIPVLGIYQGEVKNKEALQKRFRDKLQRIEEMENKEAADAIPEMKAIVDAIIHAFD